MRYKNSQTPSRTSPFLKNFLQTGRVWDEPAKREWADDVERRLYEAISQIDTRPTLLGYTIQRSANRVVVFTFARDKLSKQEMATLARGQWPCWDEIEKAVPEFLHTKIELDACTVWEWYRRWDVEDEMRRFRSEHGVFE